MLAQLGLDQKMGGVFKEEREEKQPKSRMKKEKEVVMESEKRRSGRLVGKRQVNYNISLKLPKKRSRRSAHDIRSFIVSDDEREEEEEEEGDGDGEDTIEYKPNKRVPMRASKNRTSARLKISGRIDYSEIEEESAEDETADSENVPQKKSPVLARFLTLAKEKEKENKKKKKKLGFVVVFTGVGNISKLSKIVEDLGGVVHEDVWLATHLVASRICRTEKFLCSLNTRPAPHILSPSWIYASQKANQFVGEEDHQLADLLSEREFGFSLAASLQIARQSLAPRVFLRKHFFIGENTFPDHDFLSYIVRVAGGSVLLDFPSRYTMQKYADVQSIYFIFPHKKAPLKYAKLISKDSIKDEEFIIKSILRQQIIVEKENFAQSKVQSGSSEGENSATEDNPIPSKAAKSNGKGDESRKKGKQKESDKDYIEISSGDELESEEYQSDDGQSASGNENGQDQIEDDNGGKEGDVDSEYSE